MKKKIMMFAIATVMTLPMSMTAFAGQWLSDAGGWWWQNNDGSYPADTWQWIDGNNDGIAESYYFDSQGYCLLDTTTPDGYTVNGTGAWVQDGIIQTKPIVSEQETTTKASNSANAVSLLSLNPTNQWNWRDVSPWIYKTSRNKQWSNSMFFVYTGGYVEYYVGGEYTLLTFTVAPEESMGKSFEGTFQVYGDDDDLIYESDTFNYKSSEENVSVDITGQEYIRLSCDGDDIDGRFLVKNAKVQ